DESRLALGDELQGQLTIGRLEHLVVVGLEHGPHHSAHEVVVVDDKDDPFLHLSRLSTVTSPVLYRRTISAWRASRRSWSARLRSETRRSYSVRRSTSCRSSSSVICPSPMRDDSCRMPSSSTVNWAVSSGGSRLVGRT